MRAPKGLTLFKQRRRTIGETLRHLRDERRWTQAELAERLAVSQPRLSQVERGVASLTAEQFLEVLKIFNVSATDFVQQAPEDPSVSLQDALARLGAQHLRVSNQVLPKQLANVNAVILETLVSGQPRLLTALAPVLVQHARDLNFTKLAADAHGVGVRRRLYWLIENTAAAIRTMASSPSSQAPPRYRLAARRLQTAMRFAEGYEKVIDGTFDLLDKTITSHQTAEQVERESSSISKRWRIISSLQPQDFASALTEAHAGD